MTELYFIIKTTYKTFILFFFHTFEIVIWYWGEIKSEAVSVTQVAKMSFNYCTMVYFWFRILIFKLDCDLFNIVVLFHR